MSRVAQPKSAGVTKRDSRQGGGSGDPQDEICPVCKSSRYLNSSLRFLVNPECYHKMCESCVDRIFSHGPAQCPIQGCRRTLRKARFREQTFEDIAVEREVDIRRRVAAVFNRREDEFETVRDYNDYLNDVEDITFNLINNIDVEATQRRFEQYRDAHEREIAANADLAQRESLSYSALQKAEREQARQRREAARREEAEERKEQQEGRRDALRLLASDTDVDPDALAKQGSSGVTLKKRMNRQAAVERAQQLHAATSAGDDPSASSSASNPISANGSSDLVIKGLKAKPKAEPEAPIDPFGGLSLDHRNYFSLQDDYVWNVLQDARLDPMLSAGGYDVASFSNRSLCEAFAGLGVFIAEEMVERDKAAQNGGGGVAGVGAGMAAVSGTSAVINAAMSMAGGLGENANGGRDVEMGDDPF